MLERVHDHIIEEMKLNTRTDIVFVLTSIALNFVVLSVNAAIAGDDDSLIVMLLFVLLAVVVNLTVEIGLIKGRQNRYRLLSGLVRMYKDQNVDAYYDASLLRNYNARYVLFMVVVLVTGIIAILVPFVSL